MGLQGEDTVLIADIGGTNCRFELWRIPLGGEPRQVLAKVCSNL